MITFENVSKIYKGGVEALHNASATIEKGEFVFLVGPSGSGKSTMLSLINREVTADRGRIFVAGKDIARLSSWRVPYLRRNIGCIFQDYKLLANKTVYENVAFALEVIGRPRHVVKTQVPAILELVGLETKAGNFPHQLSGGEQQRVAFARALIHEPRLVVCDEPTAALDAESGRRIMRLLADIAVRPDRAVLVVTHDSRIFDFADRIARMEDGRIIEIEMTRKEAA